MGAVVGVGGLVVVVMVAVVGVDVAFGFVVATEEPHPSATIPANGIRADAASRFNMGTYPSRTRDHTSCVAGVWGDVPLVPASLAPSTTVRELHPGANLTNVHLGW